MSSGRSFKMAAKAANNKAVYEPIDYELEDSNGVKRTVVANYPGDGQITILIAMSATDDAGTAGLGAIFDMLSATFSTGDYRYIRAHVRSEELSVELLMELIKDMVEQWTSFPTELPSDSPASPPSTGGRSTGRVHSPKAVAS